MAVIAGERKAIPSANPKPPKQAPVPGGNPWHIAGAGGQTIGTLAPPTLPAPAPVAPPAPVTPPPPPDFKALALIDPDYIEGKNRLEADHTTTTAALKRAFLGLSQGAQDDFNAHGALFSGAAAQAQTNLGADADRQQAAEDLNYDRGGHDLYQSVLKRLMTQYTGGMA